MNQAISDIIARRSCRSYDPNKKLSKEQINDVLSAALYAPTGKNTQQTLFITITNPEELKKLSELNRRIGGWKEGFDPFYGAPCAIIVIAPKEYNNGIYDGSIALGYMMLAAKSLGLGSCWIHRAKEAFELPEGKKFLQDLGIKGEYIGIGNLALGYPLDQNIAPKKIKDGRLYFVD